LDKSQDGMKRKEEIKAEVDRQRNIACTFKPQVNNNIPAESNYAPGKNFSEQLKE